MVCICTFMKQNPVLWKRNTLHPITFKATLVCCMAASWQRSSTKIIGKAGESKGKIAEAWAGIYDAETDELLAEGTGMHIDVPNQQFDTSKLEELGWKVYPD